MPATVRKRRKGEGGKAWKIVGPAGKVEGESDTKKDAEISANIRTRAHEKKKGGK
jgi:hypothetical protein